MIEGSVPGYAGPDYSSPEQSAPEHGATERSGTEQSGPVYSGPEYSAPQSSMPGFSTPGQGGGPGNPGYGWYPPPPPPPRRGGRGVLSHLGVAVLAAAVAVGATLALDHPASTGGTTAVTTPNLPGASAVPQPASSTPAAATPSGSGIQTVVNKVEPGMVIINSTIQYQGEVAAGTGMVINSNGLVLTNNHVIEDSTKLTATVVATGKTYPVTVLGYDKTGDIALIQVENAPKLTTVPLGNSAAVKAGTSVVALGNAEGGGTILPAAGTITAVNQQITASDSGGTITSETLHGMLQTNANIVSGDSGGPLSDASGQVIGMDTAGNGQSNGQGTGLNLGTGEQTQATGFAIPINTALAVAQQIAAGRASSTVSIGYPPFIGIFYTASTDSNPQQQLQNEAGNQGGFGGFGGSQQPACYTSNTNLQVPAQAAPVNSGALVDGVICSSPAANAGLTGGAVITAVDGKTVTTPNQLATTLAPFKPGDTITVTWANLNGKSTTSSLHLVAGPPQ
jgi:S1-C subfamily serine protease